MGDQGYFVYILHCSDDSLYVGLTADLATRVAEHKQGTDPRSYTYRRRPLKLIWSQMFGDHDEAFTVERQIKGWSRAKKLALIEGGVDSVHAVGLQERRRRERGR